jgi:hypothetical protein
VTAVQRVRAVHVDQRSDEKFGNQGRRRTPGHVDHTVPVGRALVGRPPSKPYETGIPGSGQAVFLAALGAERFVGDRLDAEYTESIGRSRHVPVCGCGLDDEVARAVVEAEADQPFER